jgi:hypothetical protein
MNWRRNSTSMVLIAACSGAAGASDAVNFGREIAPLLQNRCATCHLTGQEAGNMALHAGAAFASVVGVPSVESALLRVKPGFPEQSYLMLKLEGRHLDAGGSGQRMPLGQAPLDAATLQKVRSWIAAGAQQ